MPVFEYRHYEIAPGMMDHSRRYVRECSLPAFARHGFILVGGPWEVVAGTTNSVHYVLEWQDFDARDRGWDAMFADPEYKRLREEIWADGPIALRSHIQFWRKHV